MSPSGSTPDVRAVVRALDALTTQVKRLANHTANPASFALAPPVADDRDTPTTPTDDATTPLRLTTPCAACTHPFNWHKAGVCQVTECGCIASAIEAPAADEDALRDARRDSLDILLARAARVLPESEAAMLREHIAKETSEHDTMRAVAAGNKQHVQLLFTELERANAVTAEAKKLLERRTKKLRQRAEIAETELRVLREGLRANGADPTQIQNLWAQIRLRNRQWREAKREAAVTRSMLESEGGDVALVDEMLATVAKAEREAREAQAAIERVRALRDPIAEALEAADYRQDMRRGDLADSIMPVILGALDGTEQPATEADFVDQYTDPNIISNDH